MAAYDDMISQNQDLIRKTLGGAAFLGPDTVDPITTFTTHTPAVTGPPAVAEKIELTELPEGMLDVGYLTDDGIGFETETSTSDITSWQSTAPTRQDIVSQIDSITMVMQETKLITLELSTGAIILPGSLAANTKELSIERPERPSSRYWRMLAVGVDGEGEDEIFVGRYYPRVKVTGTTGQKYGKGDEALGYGITLSAYVDTTLGYSMRYLFGGRGWKKRAVAMGFSA